MSEVPPLEFPLRSLPSPSAFDLRMHTLAKEILKDETLTTIGPMLHSGKIEVACGQSLNQ